MQYLFFDIECADGKNICSLGYVRTDEALTPLEKRDILIHPKCAFQLGRRKGEPYLKLAYDNKEFYKHPPFPAVYDELRDLLTAQDAVYIGHSVASDLGFLQTACRRYNKPPLQPNVYDTQKLYARLYPEQGIRSLETIVAELNADTAHLTAHKSCDDAEMTMLAAKALCAAEACDLAELLAKYPDCLVTRESIDKQHRASLAKRAERNLQRRKRRKKSATTPAT